MSRAAKKPAPWEQAIPVTLAVPIIGIGDDDSFVLYKDATLPFVPRKGDMLAAGLGNDFIEVESVYWSQAEGLSIWFESLEDRHEQMIADGWKPEFSA